MVLIEHRWTTERNTESNPQFSVFYQKPIATDMLPTYKTWPDISL
jgi:hypothetical protein